MKKILLIFAIVAFSLSSYATTYYVVASGGSNTNSGADSTANALATLAGAVSKSVSGDVIWLCAGTHTINTTVNLPAGVSIMGSGSGVASKITSTSITAEYSSIIKLYSSSQTDGAQSISYLTFDGNNLTAAQALWIEKRNNVKIHHCVFKNFRYMAGYWICNGGDIGSDPYSNITYPTNYCTGSELYNNTITNCSGFESDYGRGAFILIGHDGMKIHDNIITQNQRTIGNNGYCLKIVFLRGSEIYNNTLTLGNYTWCFAIESFVMEGVNIHDNNIVGGIDVNISRKNSSGKSYDYGLWIHHNNLGPSSSPSQEYYGMLLEFYHSDDIIEKNTINYCTYGISYVPRSGNTIKNNRISYNVIKNAPSGAYMIQGGMGPTTSTYRNIYIYNNVFHGKPLYGLSLFGTWHNLNFKNNIFTGATYYWGALRETRSDSVFITNNILYNNSNSNEFYVETAPTNYTNSNNIVSDPLFANVTTGDFTLQSSSPAIDAGTDVGLTDDILSNNLVNSPDIGAYEYNSSTPATPRYVSSSVENATPSTITLNYNLTLANFVPATSAFTVMVNSTARAVTAVAVSGTQVLLTLANPVAYGDVVTVAYTKPASNFLQTGAGGEAASFSATLVTNNLAALPVIVSAAIANATPSRLDMNYSLTLANIVPATSAFTVMVNSTARTVTAVAISGTQVRLTLASAVSYGDVVTVAYTKPASSFLQTAAGGAATSLSATSVTNNVAAIPVFSNASIANATPSRLDMTYSLTLANIVPAASAFTVMVNSTARTVSSVAISGTQVRLTLASPVVTGDVVTVAYTKPASNFLQTAAGGQAASFSAMPVTNNVTTSIPVFVSAAIANATPSRLDMNYSITLANIIPATSSFTVMVNSIARSVSSIAISGAQVQLTLASAVRYGDVVTVAYTKPASNYLQTAAGGAAVTLGTTAVTNNVNISTPVFLSAEINNETPARVEMTFSLSLANVVPDASAFKVTVNSTQVTITSVSVSNTKVYLTLSKAIVYGDVVTVTYTRPTTNGLQSPEGALVVSFGPSLATNNTNESGNNTPEENISFYPNPASDHVIIKMVEPYTTIATVRIIELTGRVSHVSKLDPNGNDYPVYFSLKSGIYLIQVMLGNTIVYAQKLVIIAE
ncbi:MAG TPA: SwmB domain-containing protein [Bacteroidales bacterium]|mgnify:CR=1 FL=1|nr:SwmB domain-containing protein [Bacteroidales bacterium]